MREFHMIFSATVKNRYASVNVETSGMKFHFEGPISMEHFAPTVYDGNLVYFHASKVVNFELTKTEERENGLLDVKEITGALVPDVAEAIKTIETAIRGEFPIIGPALIMGLRKKFND